MCPLCEPCAKQAALWCSLVVYKMNIGVLGVWGIRYNLHPRSGRTCCLDLLMPLVSCPVFRNTSFCFENYFHLAPLFPDIFLLLAKILSFLKFLSFQLKGNSCFMKGVGKAANPNWYKRFLLWCFVVNTALRGCRVLQCYRWLSSLQTGHPTPSSLLWEFFISQSTNGSVCKPLLHNLPAFI